MAIHLILSFLKYSAAYGQRERRLFSPRKIGVDKDEIWFRNRRSPIYHLKNTNCANENIKCHIEAVIYR